MTPTEQHATPMFFFFSPRKDEGPSAAGWSTLFAVGHPPTRGISHRLSSSRSPRRLHPCVGETDDDGAKKAKGEKKRVLGIIPARYGSTRFPAKPLALIGGKPMIWHTYTNATKAKNLDYCCVATDDERIERTVKEFGGQVVMTDPKWENGTERCLEVLQKLQAEGKDFDVVVNIQGDEPFIEAHHIETVAKVVAESDAVMGTLARPATGEAVGIASHRARGMQSSRASDVKVPVVTFLLLTFPSHFFLLF